MKNKTIITIIVLLIISLITYLIVTSKPTHFKEIPLSQNNYITNTTDNKVYDTIVSHSLDILDIKNQKVIIAPLEKSGVNTSDYNGIKGALGESKGTYVIFLGKLTTNEALEIIPHEVWHLKQYYDGRHKSIDNNTVLYDGKIYYLNQVEYMSRLWEIEAYQESPKVERELRKSYLK